MTPSARVESFVAVAAVGAIAMFAWPAISDQSDAQAEMPDLEIRELPDASLSELDDGYSHFIVSLAEVESTLDQPVPIAEPLSRRLVLNDDDEPVIVWIGGSDGVQQTEQVDPIAALETNPAIAEVTPLRNGLVAVSTELTLEQLTALPLVATVTPDVGLMALHSHKFPVLGDPSYEVLQWALENTGQKISGRVGTEDADIDAPSAWTTATGEGVVVAVIDSGINTEHADIADSLWTNPGEICDNNTDDDNNGFVDDCHGWDFLNNDGTVYDPASSDNHDHGTAMAGAIAAPRDGVGTTGVAPAAKIMSLKIIAQQTLWMSDAVVAIDYAVDNGADVINISWGSTPSTAQADVTALKTAIDRAIANNVVVVAAAGNESVDIDGKAIQPASLPNPGVITVSASTGTDTRASFSAFGPNTVEIFAPGHLIAGPVTEGWAYSSGTSVATAHVSGAAALVLEMWPDMTPAMVSQLLVDKADTVAALEGLAKQPARLNVGNLFSSSDATASILFGGFDQIQEDEAAALSVSIARTAEGTSNLVVRGTLVALPDGIAHGVVSHSVSVEGRDAETNGMAQLDLAEMTASDLTTTINLATALPAGDFALVAELVDPLTNTVTQPASAVFFTVEAEVLDPLPPPPPPAPDPVTEPPDAPSPDEGTPAPTTVVVPTPDNPPQTEPGQSPAPEEDPVDGEATVELVVPVEQAPIGPGAPGGGAAAGPPEEGEEVPPSEAARPPEPEPQPEPSVPSDPQEPGAEPATEPSTSPQPEPTEAPPQTPADPTSGPTIDSITPSVGSTAGGTLVSILGTGFEERSTIMFGEAVVGLPSWLSDTHIIVETRAHPAGTVDVSVISPAGQTATLPDGFTFLNPGETEPDPDPTPTPAPTPTPDAAPGRPDTPQPGTTNPGGQRPIGPGNSPVETGDFTGEEPSNATASRQALQLSLGETTSWRGLTVARLTGPSDIVNALLAGSDSQRCTSSSCPGVALA